MTVCVSASRSMTPAQGRQLFPMPCSSRRAGPSPARTKARLWPWTTRVSETWREGIDPVHQATVAAPLTARGRPLPRRVLVVVDERQQALGVRHHAEGLQPVGIE